MLPLLFSVCLILFCWLIFACECFLRSKPFRKKKQKKKHRLEIVLITSLYYTTSSPLTVMRLFCDATSLEKYHTLELMVFITEAVICICSSKQRFLKILQYSQEDKCGAASFLIKLQVQVFCGEYCEIFKNNIFIEHLRWMLLLTLEHIPKLEEITGH